MDITQIDENFSATAQIQPQDVATLAAAGFKSIVCNRADGESEGQPTFAAIAAAAAENSLECCHLPVIPGQISDADAAAFIQHTDELPRPILGFCGSGMRASTLWAAAKTLTEAGQ